MTKNRNVVTLTLSNTISVTANGLWIMFMPVYFEEVGFDIIQISLLFSVGALLQACFSPLGGRLADRYGRKFLVITGRSMAASGALVIAISSLSLVGLLSNQILVTGFLIVLSSASIRGPASSMLIMESSHKKRKGITYMATERVVPSIPPAVSVMIGGFLYSSGFRTELFLWGAIGLVIATLVLIPFLTETLGQDHAKPEVTSERKLPTGVFLLLFSFAFILDGVSAKALSWYVPLYLVDFGVSFYGLLISISTLVIALFGIISGLVVDRLGVKPSLVSGWLLLAVAVVLFGSIDTPLLLLVLYCVWVAFDTIDTSIPPIVISERYPSQERAQRLGWFRMIVYGSLFIGPLLTSTVVFAGANAPFYLKGAMNILAALVVYFLLNDKNDGAVGNAHKSGCVHVELERSDEASYNHLRDKVREYKRGR